MEEIKKNLKVINIGVAVLLLILLFVLNVASVSYYQQSIACTALTLTGAGGIFGLLSFMLVLLAGASVFVKPEHTKTLIAASIITILLACILGTSQEVAGFGKKPSLGVGFFLLLIVDIAWAAINFLAKDVKIENEAAPQLAKNLKAINAGGGLLQLILFFALPMVAVFSKSASLGTLLFGDLDIHGSGTAALIASLCILLTLLCYIATIIIALIKANSAKITIIISTITLFIFGAAIRIATDGIVALGFGFYFIIVLGTALIVINYLATKK